MHSFAPLIRVEHPECASCCTRLWGSGMNKLDKVSVLWNLCEEGSSVKKLWKCLKLSGKVNGYIRNMYPVGIFKRGTYVSDRWSVERVSSGAVELASSKKSSLSAVPCLHRFRVLGEMVCWVVLVNFNYVCCRFFFSMLTNSTHTHTCACM